ncbi:acyl-CoA synthetase (AMP-forming)/AMP-acid ligase II [Streptacidiphilus sp. MAP12-33]|uniref:AMP-binding protein n=1 Tax=Streptacidiphilus sp. MAP12-33 TaxID=3156266 RepID=UPI003512138F
MSNLAVNLTGATRQVPHRPAVRRGRKLLTYAGLDEASARVAGGLIAHGIRPGDRVGLALDGAPAFAALYYGVLRVGAVAVVVSPRLGRDKTRDILDASAARLCFAEGSEPARPTEPALPARCLRVSVGPDFLDQVALWPLHAGLVDRADDETAVITWAQPADGDPVDPAAAPTGLSHRELRASAFVAATLLLDLKPSDTVLSYAPMSGPLGQTCALNAVILAGASLSQPPNPDDLTTAALTIVRERATILAGEPVVFSTLVHAAPRGLSSTSLRLGVSSGPLPSEETRSRISRALGVPLVEAEWPTGGD